MSLDDIKNLPVRNHAMDDCVLLLWVTDPLLKKAFEVIEAWGFSYKTVGFLWAKQNKKSNTFFTGMGYWTRANPEQCLLATIGHPKRKAKDVQRLIVSPRREHSRKPDEVRTKIEKLYGNIPRIELFARTRIEGWDVWGNEIDEKKEILKLKENKNEIF